MKRSKTGKIGMRLLALLLLSVSLSACAARQVVPELVGLPQADRYAEGAVASCPWDMAVWQDELYVGGGDYGPNDGPVDIWCYNGEAHQWRLSGSVPDEEVSRFLAVGGTLVAPGIDPREDWDQGNFYTLTGGTWQTSRVLPDVIHNFDVAEYDGRLFFACGVPAGKYPVLCSQDGGRTFFEVPMYKDGEPVSTAGCKTVRSYDFFVLGGELYATLFCMGAQTSFDLYRYEDGCFVYYDAWLGKLQQRSINNNIVAAKQEFSGKMFFTVGYLYVTENMRDYVCVAFPENETVYDLWVDGDVLYVLCGLLRPDGSYEVSVWENKRGGNVQFELAFSFFYDVPPLSLAKLGDTFYIGMGDGKHLNPSNGKVLCVSPTDKKW